VPQIPATATPGERASAERMHDFVPSLSRIAAPAAHGRLPGSSGTPATTPTVTAPAALVPLLAVWLGRRRRVVALRLPPGVGVGVQPSGGGAQTTEVAGERHWLHGHRVPARPRLRPGRKLVNVIQLFDDSNPVCLATLFRCAKQLVLDINCGGVDLVCLLQRSVLGKDELQVRENCANLPELGELRAIRQRRHVLRYRKENVPQGRELPNMVKGNETSRENRGKG